MKIKPIKDLRNTNEISLDCHKDSEPIFITKNGYNDLVIMSDECYSSLHKGQVSKTNYLNTVKPTNANNQYGFVKIGLGNIDIKISDVNHNVNQIKKIIDKAEEKYVNILIFQELTLTGYTCRDLFYNDSLIEQSFEGIEKIRKYSVNKKCLIAFGAPIKFEGKLYNSIIVILNGKILGVTSKKFFTDNIDERSFSSYNGETTKITINNEETYFGNDILFVDNNFSSLKFSFEIGDDILNINSSFSKFIRCGANLVINPCSTKQINEITSTRHEIIKGMSLIGKCSIVSLSGSKGESTVDYVLSGDNLVYENGETLHKSNLFNNDELIIQDIDFAYLENLKSKNQITECSIDKIGFSLEKEQSYLDREYSKLPFLYEGKDAHEKYLNIIKTQASGLIKRLDASYSKTLVVALSGGLDSTLALLVAKEAFKMSKRDFKDIIAVTIPCFGTSKRTHDNAVKFADILGVTFKEVNIKESVLKHFDDIGHDKEVLNATYENAQARERTQVAMDIANDLNGIMLGTGDLSELCLGWATYNGDHMSMYGVNSSIPKTLVRALVETYAREYKETKEVLEDIIGTPISPELLPLKDGEIEQKTEDKIGPYELVDFFIYHFLVNNFSIRKILFIAKETFKEKYDEDTIKKWLISFIKRFYSSQFKRSCMPDGPRVTVASVSPRNGLYMPSDASVNSMLEELK